VSTIITLAARKKQKKGGYLALGAEVRLALQDPLQRLIELFLSHCLFNWEYGMLGA
jgi:hypothetical protein